MIITVWIAISHACILQSYIWCTNSPWCNCTGYVYRSLPCPFHIRSMNVFDHQTVNRHLHITVSLRLTKSLFSCVCCSFLVHMMYCLCDLDVLIWQMVQNLLLLISHFKLKNIVVKCVTLIALLNQVYMHWKWTVKMAVWDPKYVH
jgi:hypothetical protein